MTAHQRIWPVILSGGSGTRLWPLSRAGSPKFLHDLTGSGRTLIQATVDRLRVLAGERVLVVTGAAHADAVREHVRAALDSGTPLTLSDERGHSVTVPASAIGYVDIAAEQKGRVGFGG